MLIEQIHAGDSGTIFETQILEEDQEIVDISNAVYMYFQFMAPDGTITIRPAFFSTNGTDGKMRMVCSAADFLQTGQWQVQAYISMPGWTGHGQVIGFPVYENIFNIFSEAYTTYFSFVLHDNLGKLWQVTILPSQNTYTQPISSVPLRAYTTEPFILQDILGNFWQVTIDSTGHLTTTQVQNPQSFLTFLALRDVNGTTWFLTVLPDSHLDVN